MLPKKYRLHKSSEFDLAFAQGRKVVSGWLVLYGLTHSEGDLALKLPKLGVVVTKALGSAVERNRVRRVVRETFQENAVKNQLFRNLSNVVVVVRPKASQIKNPELRKSLEDSLKKLDQCLSKFEKKIETKK